MRLENEKIYTRAGQALNRSRIRTLRSQCLYLFKHINVRPDGKVSLCSNDALGSVTLGDLKKESILDVWYGETFEEYREKIIKGRKYIDACASCDNLHYNQNYGSWVSRHWIRKKLEIFQSSATEAVSTLLIYGFKVYEIENMRENNNDVTWIPNK